MQTFCMRYVIQSLSFEGYLILTCFDSYGSNIWYINPFISFHIFTRIFQEFDVILTLHRR